MNITAPYVTDTRGSLTVQVDPSGLAPGVHYASVRAFDSARPDKGALFSVPVTVVVAEPVADTDASVVYAGQRFAPGTVQRRFVAVPRDATWAVVRIALDSRDGVAAAPANARFVLHAVQTLPQLSCKSSEFHKMIDLYETAEAPLVFAVRVSPGHKASEN